MVKQRHRLLLSTSQTFQAEPKLNVLLCTGKVSPNHFEMLKNIFEFNYSLQKELAMITKSPPPNCRYYIVQITLVFDLINSYYFSVPNPKVKMIYSIGQLPFEVLLAQSTKVDSSVWISTFQNSTHSSLQGWISIIWFSNLFLISFKISFCNRWFSKQRFITATSEKSIVSLSWICWRRSGLPVWPFPICCSRSAPWWRNANRMLPLTRRSPRITWQTRNNTTELHVNGPDGTLCELSGKMEKIWLFHLFRWFNSLERDNTFNV